jgi:hypothetical protein
MKNERFVWFCSSAGRERETRESENSWVKKIIK